MLVFQLFVVLEVLEELVDLEQLSGFGKLVLLGTGVGFGILGKTVGLVGTFGNEILSKSGL